MAIRRQRSLPSRTVVVLEPEDRKSLQQRAEQDNISASEVLRRSLRAYTANSVQQDEEHLRALIGEMNAALDAALASTRDARVEIRKNLDQIKQRQKERLREETAGMTIGTEVLSIVKKIFLVSDELTRLSAEVKDLTRVSNDHDIRLAVIETTLVLTHRSSKTYPARHCK